MVKHHFINDRRFIFTIEDWDWDTPRSLTGDTPVRSIFDHIAKLFKEFGSNIWYEKDAKDLLPDGYTNPHSPNGKFTKEKDIMDVWFDSGSSWNGVLNDRDSQYPSDLYLEGPSPRW